jgi:hypothetical protein
MAEIWKRVSMQPLPQDFGQRPWPSTFRVLLDSDSDSGSLSTSRSDKTTTSSSLRAIVEAPSSFLMNVGRAPKAALSWHAYITYIKERKVGVEVSPDEEEPTQYAQPREEDEDPSPPYCAPPPLWDEVHLVYVPVAVCSRAVIPIVYISLISHLCIG